MLENTKLIDNNGVSLYVRHVPAAHPSKKAVILLNSATLCVESTMGISMGSISCADYLASKGIHAFLMDLRGYGQSSPVEEQLVNYTEFVQNPLTLENYFEDILCCCNYIKEQVDGAEISIFGFSYLGTIACLFGDTYDGVFENIIALNPNWITNWRDEKRGADYKFHNEQEPFSIVRMAAIKDRLDNAQPAGKDFREELWYDEAYTALKTYHKTYNHETDEWKIAKTEPVMRSAIGGYLSIPNSRVLLMTAQYDVENPYFIVNRLHNSITSNRKYIKMIPNATHLCIWEKQRHLVYEWTAEMIL